MLKDDGLDTGEEISVDALPELTTSQTDKLRTTKQTARLDSLVRSSPSAFLLFLGPTARFHLCHLHVGLTCLFLGIVLFSWGINCEQILYQNFCARQNCCNESRPITLLHSLFGRAELRCSSGGVEIWPGCFAYQEGTFVSWKSALIGISSLVLI